MREELKIELISFLDMANENEKYKCNLENTSDSENTLIFAVNRINEKYHCFVPDEVPYLYYAKENFKGIESELSFIANKLSNLKNRWKIHDFLWIHFKSYQSVVQAYKGFIDYIFTNDEYDVNYYIFNRCANLYMVLKQVELEYDFTRTLYRMIELGKNNENVQSLKILENAYEKQWLTATQLITPVNEKLVQYESIEKSYLFLAVAVLLEKIIFDSNGMKRSNGPCKIKEITALRRKKVEFYLSIANNPQEQIFRRVDNIKSAIKILKGIKNTEEERCDLQVLLKELQKELSSSLTKFSESIDISDIMEMMKNSLSKLDDIEIFYYFLLSTPIFEFEEAEKKMNDIEGGFFSKMLFTEHILNKHGGLEAIMPNLAQSGSNNSIDVVLPHVEKFCCERYCRYVDMTMVHVFLEIEMRHIDYKAEVYKIVNNSLFISDNRKQAFSNGIIAGFEKDYMTAMCILAPQVEGAVRELCLICGDATIKINQDKTEEYLSLDSLLKSQKINECIDKKILFNIKMIFTSVYGFNMRNKIAHGIMDDEDFKSKQCFFTWWFVLRVCLEFSEIKIDFVKAINEKIS